MIRRCWDCMTGQVLSEGLKTRVQVSQIVVGVFSNLQAPCVYVWSIPTCKYVHIYTCIFHSTAFIFSTATEQLMYAPGYAMRGGTQETRLSYKTVKTKKHWSLRHNNKCCLVNAPALSQER